MRRSGWGLQWPDSAAFTDLDGLTYEEWTKIIDINLTGPMLLTKAVGPVMKRQGGGRIVQVSSEGGQIAYPGFSLYHASKWGIEGFMDSVRHELAPFGIGVTIVEPGTTGTSESAALGLLAVTILAPAAPIWVVTVPTELPTVASATEKVSSPRQR